MTTEDKLLLVQDLCARLPYGVQVQHTTTKINGPLHDIIVYPLYKKGGDIYDIDAVTDFFGECDYVYLEYFKPYLFPLTYEVLSTIGNEKWCIAINTNGDIATTAEGYDWLNAHHYDYRNLIKKGLAIDCTNLNIY